MPEKWDVKQLTDLQQLLNSRLEDELLYPYQTPLVFQLSTHHSNFLHHKFCYKFC